MGLHFVLGQAQILPLGVVQGERMVWRIKPVWGPELQFAGQAQEWIFVIVQGRMIGFASRPGLQLVLEWSWEL